jgi:hypothetical protein
MLISILRNDIGCERTQERGQIVIVLPKGNARSVSAFVSRQEGQPTSKHPLQLEILRLLEVSVDVMDTVQPNELAWLLALAFSPFLVGFPFEDQLVKRICENVLVQVIGRIKRSLLFVLTLPLLFSICSVCATFFFGLGIISVSLLPFVIGSAVILLSKGSQVMQIDEVRNKTI